MRSTYLAVLGTLLVPLVTGCASYGTNYDEAAVARLRPGMAKAEVIAMLGKPTTTVTLADGSQHVNWLYSHGTAFRASVRSITLIFGPDGTYRQTFTTTASELR